MKVETEAKSAAFARSLARVEKPLLRVAPIHSADVLSSGSTRERNIPSACDPCRLLAGAVFGKFGLLV